MPLGQCLVNICDQAELLLQLYISLVVCELGFSSAVSHRDAFAGDTQGMSYAFDFLLRVVSLIV